MRRIKQDTWQEKIDPEFDELIKVYLVFLRDCFMPKNDGFICINEKYLKLIENKDISNNPYDLNSESNRKNIKKTIDLDESKGIQKISTLVEEIGKNENISTFIENLKPIIKYSDNLKEGLSKEYYQKCFMPILSEANFNEFREGKKPDEVQDYINNLTDDIGALMFSIATTSYTSVSNEASEGDIDDNFLIQILLSRPE